MSRADRLSMIVPFCQLAATAQSSRSAAQDEICLWCTIQSLVSQNCRSIWETDEVEAKVALRQPGVAAPRLENAPGFPDRSMARTQNQYSVWLVRPGTVA